MAPLRFDAVRRVVKSPVESGDGFVTRLMRLLRELREREWLNE